MARTPRPKSFQIPEPGHQPLKVKFCGSEYTLTMKDSFQADRLRGMSQLALLQMPHAAHMALFMVSKKAASMKDMKVPAEQIESSFDPQLKALIAVGFQIAVREVFSFVCEALGLTEKEIAYAKDHYDIKEMIPVFCLILGALERPFGGTPSDSLLKPKQTTTDSISGECATQ